MTAFEEMGLLPDLGRAVEEMGWTLPRDIQADSLPMILGGGDVLMAAETGSGKTGAFCLPTVQIVWETIRDFQSGKLHKEAQQAAQATVKPPERCQLSKNDRNDGLAIDQDGLVCQSRDFRAWNGCRATHGIAPNTGGKYYYEAVVNDEGLCRVGWSTIHASLDVGTDNQSFGFGGTGKKSFCKNFDDYGETFGKGDVIGCMLDLYRHSIRYSKNGKELGEAFPVPANIQREVLYPAVVLKNGEMKFNFGDSPFKFGPPPDYVGVSQAGQHLVANPNFHAKGGNQNSKLKLKNNAPMAIILEPSRELAEQTFGEINKFKKFIREPELRTVCCVGGVSAQDQLSAINAGIDIVVGTTGRLEDMVNSGDLSLENVRFFILDEADGLLMQGHERLINNFWKNIPKVTPDGRRLQMIVCSATLHNIEVKRMADRLMHFPTWIDLKGQDSVPDTVHQVICLVNPTKDVSWQTMESCITTDTVHRDDGLDINDIQRPEVLSEAVKMLKGDYAVAAIRALKMQHCLVFCRTKLDCDNFEAYCTMLGGGPKASGHELSCACLHSDRTPDERRANLDAFKAQKVNLLICTDVAARGIDVAGLPFVLQLTLPDEKTNYVHRIGRVGRAERMGLAVSLVATVPEKVWFHGPWCKSHGKNCHNTNLTDVRGCCMWYDEQELLGEIEEHLGVTIGVVDKTFKVPVDEFEGKVVYGERRQQKTSLAQGYKYHTELLANTVADLQALEHKVQQSYLLMRFGKVGQMSDSSLGSGDGHGGGRNRASEKPRGVKDKSDEVTGGGEPMEVQAH